jgi:outer membrane protein OmpA-like peptidoglycan-associated protein
VNGDDHERVLPPSTSTPTRVPDAASKSSSATKDVPRRAPGPAHDISNVRIHAADPNTLAKVLDHFAHNSAVLTGNHRKLLDELAAEIAARLALAPGAKARITMSGHTDTSGDETHNEALGLQRADAAKAALEGALRRKHVAADRLGDIATESLGETQLAKPTPDEVKEPLNRRVEVTVTIEAPLPTSSTPVAPPATPEKDEPRKKPIDLNLPPTYKLPEEDWWQRTERERRQVEEYDRTHPRRTRSVTDVLVEGVTQGLEPVIRKLPKSLRQKARDAIRSGIEAGTEKACEAAIDASGVTGDEAQALKAACKAALKAKPGGAR